MSNLYRIPNPNEKTMNEIHDLVVLFIQGKAPSTQVTYLSAWQHFYDWWLTNYPYTSLLNATPLQVQKYFLDYEKRAGQSHRLGADVRVAKTTLKKIALCLKSCFDAVTSELRVHLYNPFEPEIKKYMGITNKNRRPTERTPDEAVLKLCNAPNPHIKIGLRDRAILSSMFGGGLRRSEVTSLRICHVKIINDCVVYTLLNTKNGDDANQVIARELSSNIIEYLGQRKGETEDPNAWFFIDYRGVRGRAQEDKPLSDSSVYKLFCYWRDVVGLPKNISPHSARATAITRLLDLGYSHRDVQKFSRHKSIGMVEKYDKGEEKTLEDLANQLSFSNNVSKKKL